MHIVTMNKTIVLICLFIIGGLMGLTGCTEFFSDFGGEDKVIPVSIIASATVKNQSGEPVPGVELRFDLSKTNGQDFRAYRTTDDYGYAVVNQYSYNLHKGQVITAKCMVSTHVMVDEKTATYDQFLPDMETHATTAWYAHFDFTLDT